MIHLYIEEPGGSVRRIYDTQEWHNQGKRWQVKDEVKVGHEMVVVSTVFMGIDHNYTCEGPPLLYETMVFGGEHHKGQQRYSTRAEAEEGHKDMIEKVKGSLQDDK